MSDTAAILDVMVIHHFEGGDIYVGKNEQGKSKCWIKRYAGGEMSYVPHEDDYDELDEWLEGTDLDRDLFLDKVDAYQLWG